MRGGANGARLALEPQKNWAANNPNELSNVLETLTAVQTAFNDKQRGDNQVSLADVIVLGGVAALEKAAADAGVEIDVPFVAGRADALQEQTDVDSFAVLEPSADGFRNYYDDRATRSPVTMLIDRANLLTLSVPEMTVLVGGMRALNANADGSAHGVFTSAPGTLSNDFFVNLLDMSTTWSPLEGVDGVYEGKDVMSGAVKWTATPVDLMFGSSSELRSVAEVYASSNGDALFVQDFVAAWTKVMNLDRL